MPGMDAFDGSPVSWDVFCCSFKFYATVHRWSDVTRLEGRCACLRGGGCTVHAEGPDMCVLAAGTWCTYWGGIADVRGPPLAVRMDRHGEGQLETGFIREFADHVCGNVTDGYLDAGGGMV